MDPASFSTTARVAQKFQLEGKRRLGGAQDLDLQKSGHKYVLQDFCKHQRVTAMPTSTSSHLKCL